MADRSRITNAFGTPVTLPTPFGAHMLGVKRRAVTVDGNPDAVVALLGGAEAI